MKNKFLKKCICTLAVTATTLMSTSFITNAAVSVGSYGVGTGKVWPAQVNAPYVDLVDWVTTPGYYAGNDNGGPANLKRLSQDTGVKFFNLAFIQSTGSTSNGKVNWGWGGYSVLSEGSNDSQYAAIKQSLKDLRDIGGDATISFGGVNGVALWQTTQDVNTLYNTYLDIVNGYGLTRIDLDVEGGAQNKQSNIANAKAIKMLQDSTGVDVSLTIPVLPSGLTSTQIDLLDAYLSNNVKLKCINIMAMCYGSGTLNPGENYGTASLRAMDSTKDQIKDCYKKFANTTLTDAEAYAKLGVTVSIGYESGSDPIFRPDWSKLVVDHAKEKAIGMTSFWSLNRDAKLDGNSGITTQYEHTSVFSTFGSTTSDSPVINGVSDKQIKIGDKFDALAGITATDAKDGDLTSKIVVTGSVDTSKAGNYKLTYAVTNSKGLTTTATATITVSSNTNTAPVINGVTNKQISVGDKFDALAGVTATDKEDGDLTSKIVVTGSVDTSKAGTYTLTYTVTDSNSATTKATSTVTVNNSTVKTYSSSQVYVAGDIVSYNGSQYKAKWWTMGETPGASQWGPWEKIS